MGNRYALDLIKRFEGFSSTVYLCPAGIPTIGYGHVVLKGEKFPEGIHQGEGVRLLEQDMKQAEASVGRLIVVPLTEAQRGALISFAFNLGGGALQRSTLRMRVNRQDHRGAADEFLKWCKARGKVVRGLLLRRRAEAKVYLTADGSITKDGWPSAN